MRDFDFTEEEVGRYDAMRACVVCLTIKSFERNEWADWMEWSGVGWSGVEQLKWSSDR